MTAREDSESDQKPETVTVTAAVAGKLAAESRVRSAYPSRVEVVGGISSCEEKKGQSRLCEVLCVKVNNETCGRCLWRG